MDGLLGILTISSSLLEIRQVVEVSLDNPIIILS